MAGCAPPSLVKLPQPAYDTAFLVASGDTKGGRFFLPEHELSAFSRLNRFHRLVVNTVHISYDFEPRSMRMRGYASLSGGVYQRVIAPPPRR